MLGRSAITWRQRPDMIIAVDWDSKPQLKQTNKQTKMIYFFGGSNCFMFWCYFVLFAPFVLFDIFSSVWVIG